MPKSVGRMTKTSISENSIANSELMVDSFLKSMQPVLKQGTANIEVANAICSVTNIFPLNFVENSFSQCLPKESESQSDLPVTTKAESLQDPNECVLIQQPHIPVETVGRSEDSSNDNLKISKLKLLSDYSRKKEMYLAKVSAAEQELNELRKKTEECQKRKLEAEILYNEYKQLHQQLLASE